MNKVVKGNSTRNAENLIPVVNGEVNTGEVALQYSRITEWLEEILKII